MIANRISIAGPSQTRETVEQDVTLDCTGDGSATKKKSPGTKELGDITVNTLWNPNEQDGKAQVTTATAAGTVAAAGNALVTITAAGLTGSPLALNIPVTTGAPSIWAGQIRTALAANAAIAAKFAVGGGLGTTISLTQLPVAGQVPGNDSTLNIAIATGTATGITAAPTSAATTAGVAGFFNKDNHHLFKSDYLAERATFWMIEHPNSAATGMIAHCTVKELGEPTYEANQTVKRQFTLECTGEFFADGNNISLTTLPPGITAPSDYWGKD